MSFFKPKFCDLNRIIFQIFFYVQYTASVREDADLGRVVAQVRAESLDLGANANLRYAITHGNKHGKFAMDENSGKRTFTFICHSELWLCNWTRFFQAR